MAMNKKMIAYHLYLYENDNISYNSPTMYKSSTCKVPYNHTYKDTPARTST